jgi:glucokinase
MAEWNEMPVLAVDIGGTKLMAAFISADGHMLANDVCPTHAGEGVDAVIDRLFLLIDELLMQEITEVSEYSGIGIACAGAIDTENGTIAQSPNLPGWHDIPLAEIVAERCKVDTYLINDASAAALGEFRFGAGRGVNDLILITLGTGIGGGIIIDGELYLGACGSAAEIGHMIVDVNGPPCACGSHGCLESFASGTAVARNAVNRIKLGEESSLTGMVDGKIEKITAETVGIAAVEGDRLARDIYSRAAYYLGVGLVNLVNIFNPEMIIVGGGMMEYQELLLGPAIQVVNDRAFRISAEAVQIAAAHLGNEAGVYGAAVYALDHVMRRER